MSDQDETHVVWLRRGGDKPGDVEPAGEVLEGELVDEAEYAARQRQKALERWRGYRRDAVVVGRVVRVAATHDRTVTVGKTALRHALYVPAGALVVAQRVWESKTNSRYERMMRAAEAAGNWDEVKEWEARGEQARERRHRRLMDWITAPFQLAKAFAAAVLTLTALLLATGLVLMVANKNADAFLMPFNALFTLVHWVSIALAVAWTPLVMAAPWLGIGWLWWEGKRAGRAPGWLQTAATDAPGAIVIDERSIAQALANLGIGPLARYFKDGGVLSYVKIPARDGLGVAAALRLPPGVSTAEVIRAKTKLAANLGRAGVEVWPSTGADEGLLDLWVADRGALDTGAGTWPLLESEEPVDAYRGVPVGVTLRGDQVIPPLDGTSWLIGGRPGQGKTSLARLLVMGACLDPRAEVWVHVLADNPDFDPLASRFARFHVGIGHEVAAYALQAFHDLMAEIERRGKAMRERGAATAAEAGFHPLVAVFDEVHRLFQHREYGEDAALVAEDVIKQARKYGIIVILVTQSPTATSIPKPVTRETICRVAFSVVDQVANDALLGDGHYRRGVRATELRPGSKHAPGDRGKALTVGVVPDVDWSMLLGYHVDLDGVAVVAERAERLAGQHGQRVERTAEDEPRVLLADLAAVLGEEPVPSADVPALLARQFPRWAPYRRLTGKALRAELDRLGVKVPSTGNRHPVDPAAIRRALADRPS